VCLAKAKDATALFVLPPLLPLFYSVNCLGAPILLFIVRIENVDVITQFKLSRASKGCP